MSRTIPDPERPLAGRRLLATREEGDDLILCLRARGAEAIPCPVLRIEPPEDSGKVRAAVADLPEGGWIVVTSPNGAEALGNAVSEKSGDTSLKPQPGTCPHRVPKIAAIGPGTVAALRAHGLDPALVPSDHTTEGLLAPLAREDLDGTAVLLLLGNLAPDRLERGLRDAGADVRRVTAYRTLPTTALPNGVADRIAAGTVDRILVTSPSAIRNLLALLPKAARDRAREIPAVTIGPSTSEATRAEGLEVAGEASPRSLAGIVAATERSFATSPTGSPR